MGQAFVHDACAKHRLVSVSPELPLAADNAHRQRLTVHNRELASPAVALSLLYLRVAHPPAYRIVAAMLATVAAKNVFSACILTTRVLLGPPR
jgi:hypothetical protein